MSVDVLTPPGTLALDPGGHSAPSAQVLSRSSEIARAIGAYVELAKPRLVFLVILTTAVGYWLGSRTSFELLGFLATVAGTALVAGGACAWNQVLERLPDARMRRTERRPLPSGRLRSVPAAVFSSVLTVAGLAILAAIEPVAAWVALATFVLYVAVYTPLKACTTLNTAIGAIPGALPPVIGWAAATGRLSPECWTLFLIVFLWQFPHFFAIAWIYRHDYQRAGLRMLPCFDSTGRITAGQSLLFAALLLPAGLLPTAAGLSGWWSAAGALVVGLAYLRAAGMFYRGVSDKTARQLLRTSFLYLPVLLLLLVIGS